MGDDVDGEETDVLEGVQDGGAEFGGSRGRCEEEGGQMRKRRSDTKRNDKGDGGCEDRAGCNFTRDDAGSGSGSRATDNRARDGGTTTPSRVTATRIHNTERTSITPHFPRLTLIFEVEVMYVSAPSLVTLSIPQA